jgi:hypothetical protein
LSQLDLNGVRYEGHNDVNSWTRCFVAALATAGVGALWLALDAPQGPARVAEASSAGAATALGRGARTASRD